MSPAPPATAAELESVARRRLRTTALDGPRFDSAEAVVRWFGAYQGQDHGAAKWGLSRRICPDGEPVSDAAVEAEFDTGRIVRTHVLRPTWHFVAVDDLPWLLDLTAERIRPKLRYYDKQVGLDDDLIARAKPLALRALAEEGRSLNRSELAERLAAEGIPTSGPAMSHLMFHAELDGAVCSGPRDGRHHTYLPLEQRLAEAGLKAYAPSSREESLTRLAEIFLRSHGPATAKDFAWWSGLTGRDLKVGLEGLGDVVQETFGGAAYFALPDTAPRPRTPAGDDAVRLLQAWDEFTVAYTQSKPAMLLRAPAAKPGMTSVYLHTVIEGSQVVGHWKYSTTAQDLRVEAVTWGPPTTSVRDGIMAESAVLATYLERELGDVTVREFAR